MATETILDLTAAVGITGSEWAELQRGDGTSARWQLATLAALAKNIAPTGPVSRIVGVPIQGPNPDYTAEGQMGASVGLLDLNAGGPCSIGGILAGFNGQLLIIGNISPFLVTLNKLSAGSSGANQLRMPDDFFLAQFDSKTFKYFTDIAKWVQL